MARFRKRPDEIEAVQWSGSNWHSMLDFAGKDHVSTDGARLFLKTLSGQVSAPTEVPVGYWVVRWAPERGAMPGPGGSFLSDLAGMNSGEYWIASDTAMKRDWEEAPDDSA